MNQIRFYETNGIYSLSAVTVTTLDRYRKTNALIILNFLNNDCNKN